MGEPGMAAALLAKRQLRMDLMVPWFDRLAKLRPRMQWEWLRELAVL